MHRQKMRLWMILCAITSLASACAVASRYCPELIIPAPLARDIQIVVNDDRIRVNQGGELMLREYVQTRAMLMAVCQ